jgi:GDPmannose 4,6-dehydratase
MPTAVITGVAGQDGSYLAGLLHENGYRIVGILPDLEEARGPDANPLPPGVEMVVDDLLDQDRLTAVFEKYRPDEVYNFAAHSFLGASFATPVQTGEVLAMGVARLLEAIRVAAPKARLFQASSSEMFGNPVEVPQTETTPFRPRNPYGVAKVYAHLLVGLYREIHGIHASCGILYNHESPRRRSEFVTRKITLGAARIRMGFASSLRLGSLDARRDWGYAPDFVRAMMMMLRQEAPDDYVLATGTTHSVRDLCEVAFSHVGLDYRGHVVTEEETFRPPDRAQLVGDAGKARRTLGWRPTVSFEEMIRNMVDADLERLRSGIVPKR